MMIVNVPKNHPRARSLKIREKLMVHYNMGVVALAGLMAHGRGEAFDYLIGEKTTAAAQKAIKAAAAMLLTAKTPVISVNGNTAALVAEEIVELAKITNAKIEVNLFYRTHERELAIKKLLERAGAKEILGIGNEASAIIPELGSERRRVDPRGILAADVVFVPLEDGDRTEALVKMGKKVIAVDLNPLSRTAQKATVTIVDNVVRAVPKITKVAKELRMRRVEECREILINFDNRQNLAESINLIKERLRKAAEKGETLIVEAEKL